ncbi:uncharacterized protein LOC134234538 [Saccostrea cucullata]|uniref:uncharacterized protein LOC134234538 n=1 Tax=Saccostrea cuccullata TaxID=36930 RepID=UPI002ED5BF99
MVGFILVSGLHADRCRPCDGSTSVYDSRLNSCNHIVTKEGVIISLKALNHTFTSFKNEMETMYNMVHISTNENNCVQHPLTPEVKERLPKNYKDRFIHETYAKLSFAYDVLEEASFNFTGNHWMIRNELTAVMCNMVKVNRKIHCRNSQLRPSRRMKSFERTEVCERRNVYNCSRGPELTLIGLSKVQKLVEEILGFWESCIVERPGNGKLKVLKKCRKRNKKARRCFKMKTRKDRRKCKKRKGKRRKSKAQN